jgi:hypothetical protein
VIPNEQKTVQTPTQNGYAPIGQSLPTNTQQPEEELLGYHSRGKINGQYQPVIQSQVGPQYNDPYRLGVMQQYEPGTNQRKVNGNQDILESPQYKSQYKLGGQPVENNIGHQDLLQGQAHLDRGSLYQPGMVQPEINQSFYYPRGQASSLYQPGTQPTGGLANQNFIQGSPHSRNQYQSQLRQPEVNPQSYVGGQHQVGTQQSNGLPHQDQYRNPFQPRTTQLGYYPGGETSDHYQPVTQYGLVHQGVAQRPSDFQPGIHPGDKTESPYQRSAIGSQSGTPITGLGQRPGYNSNVNTQPGYQNGPSNFQNGQASYQNGAHNIDNQKNVQSPSETQLGVHTNQYQPSSQVTQQEYGRIPQIDGHGASNQIGGINDRRIPADLITDRQQIIEDMRQPQSSINTNSRPFVEYGTEQYPASVDRQAGFQTNLSQQSSGTAEDKKVEIVQKSEDDSFSQAESSIKNGQAIASAQGRKNGGTAQTQVTGTYGGNGSFSASAQTSDKDRSAQAQVTGGKDGALSSSQGSGGVGKSQAQVNLNTKTGGTSATSQSGGLKHESQSEVS